VSDGIRKPPFAGDRFLILIARNDAPLASERAASRRRSAKKGGDGRAGVKSASEDGCDSLRGVFSRLIEA
jgi:hypothetical protein